MIIDSLTHVTPNGKWFDTNRLSNSEELLREMNSTQTSKSVVVALADYIENEFVLQECEKKPGVLIPCGSFNPSSFDSAQTAVDFFKNEFKKSRFKALKLHPRLNNYDPLNEKCLAILEELNSWKKPFPVWIDTLLYHKNLLLRKPLVDTFQQIVSTFDNINFVLLHGGGGYLLQLTDAIRDCENAYVDLSFTICRYFDSSVRVDMRYLVKNFDRRMVLGSDFPEYFMNESLRYFSAVAKGISSEKRNNILGGNLSKILEL